MTRDMDLVGNREETERNHGVTSELPRSYLGVPIGLV